MTDKERMDVVERCYSKMKRYRNLVSYYTNKNISVSYLRAKKKNDLDRIMGLYGNMKMCIRDRDGTLRPAQEVTATAPTEDDTAVPICRCIKWMFRRAM